MKNLGRFRGKEISEMAKDELLEFAEWAASRIESLEKQVEPFKEVILERELVERIYEQRKML